jgi:hypothetical protein
MEEEIKVLKREASQWQKKTELEKLRLENLAHQQAEVRVRVCVCVCVRACEFG